uniref:BTB domain-containing protein n=1 Tax=Magallana gigas TaxID=29159 RepID=A0A8W8N4J3_MAGGI
MDNIKCILVGNKGVGKAYLNNTFMYTTQPREDGVNVVNAFTVPIVNVMVDGVSCRLELWDTSGKEDYDGLRPLSYPGTDIFLLCYSIENRCSFENVEAKWIPEIEHHCPNVPILLVACKSDLRSSSKIEELISIEEGQALAGRFRAPFCETSSMTQTGVEECFNTAVKRVIECGYNKTARTFGDYTVLCLSKKKNRNEPLPPVMPLARKAPLVEVMTSTFSSDWMKALQNPVHSDVTFILEGNHKLNAHRLVLCAASKFFQKVFRFSQSEQKRHQLSDIEYESFSTQDLASGAVEGIATVIEENDGKKHTTIQLCDGIRPKSFVQVLQFLYTGLPNLPEDVTGIEDEIHNLSRLAKMFRLGQLETICHNCLKKKGFLNPRIRTFLNDNTRKRMKDMFLNNPEYADVIFHIERTKIYANKVVLGARCEVMSAMFGGSFVESQSAVSEVQLKEVTSECFMALMEYLYSDHAPIEDGDSVGIMVLADEYGHKRLVNLCELYITKEVDRSVTKQIAKSDIDVIGLLLTSQLCNAEQLSKWCLHFISTNYIAFKKRKEFSLLTGRNKKHVEEHRWPPLSYLQDVKRYEKEIKKKGEKCSIL